MGVRGASLGPTEVVGTPKLAPTGSEVPKTYPLISITPYLPCSLLLPLTPPCPLSLLGPLGPSWGLRKPWEPSEAFGSLGSLVRLRGLAPLVPPNPPHSLSLPLTPPSPLSLPASLGPSWGLRKPWEPSEAFGSLWSSVRLRGLAPLAPPYPLCSLLLPLAP